MTRAAGEHQPDHRREPDPFGGPRFGFDEAPHARAQDPEDDQPEAERRQRCTHEVQVPPLLTRPLGYAAGEDENRQHDHDLAREHPAPREVGGEQAADDRADPDRDRGRSGDQPVGARPFVDSEVHRHQRDDRRQDQHRPDALKAGPPEQQHPEARRDRRDERAAAVDHAADREGALAADDLARPSRR